MPDVAFLATCDCFPDPIYRSEADMVARAVDRLRLEMKRVGWTGAKVTQADWQEEGGVRWLKLQIGPGNGKLDVATVEKAAADRAAWRETQKKAGSLGL